MKHLQCHESQYFWSIVAHSDTHNGSIKIKQKNTNGHVQAFHYPHRVAVLSAWIAQSVFFSFTCECHIQRQTGGSCAICAPIISSLSTAHCAAQMNAISFVIVEFCVSISATASILYFTTPSATTNNKNNNNKKKKGDYRRACAPQFIPHPTPKQLEKLFQEYYESHTMHIQCFSFVG